MRTLFLFITGLFFFQPSYAQGSFPESHSSDTMLSERYTISLLADLNVTQNPRIRKMLKWHIENNKKRDGMEGFRVEIFSSSALDARERAMNEKVEFLKLYPAYNVHVTFSAPVFKVRVGDCRTKNEALKLHKRIQKDYPGAFIVPDIIDFPLLKPEFYERSD
jgi:hypothetical protein